MPCSAVTHPTGSQLHWQTPPVQARHPPRPAVAGQPPLQDQSQGQAICGGAQLQDQSQGQARCGGAHSSPCTVSYTHLTLPTICSV
eukprot:1215116-Alexandrium_andersonii.AAC.1